jgi:hypothetical protein
VTIDELTESYQQVLAAGRDKREQLQREQERQRANAKLAADYADGVKQFRDYLQQQKGAAAQLSGAIAQQLETLGKLHASLGGDGAERLKQLTAAHQRASDAGVRNVEDVRALELELSKQVSAVENQEKVLTQELLVQQKADITPEQLAEFKDVFHHFDKDGNGSLEKHELKACLQSLGDEPKDAEMDEIMARLDTQKTGKVDLPTFTKVRKKKKKKKKRIKLPHISTTGALLLLVYG